MLLIKIKAFIQQNHEVTLTRLSQQFDVPIDVMHDMVKIWVNKGVINEQICTSDHQPQSCGNGSCSGCAFTKNNNQHIVKYLWKG